MVRISRILAMVYGVMLPLLETVRRWRTLWDDPPALLDDYVIGAFLLLGVWATRRDSQRGRVVLGAAWGFLCGIAYGSIVGQWRLVAEGGIDPGPLSAVAVLWIKVCGTAVALAALFMTIGRAPQSPGGSPGPR